MFPTARTPEGKVVLYHRATAEKCVRWPVDARDMLASGDYTADDPNRVSGDSPAAPVDSPAPRALVPGLENINAEHSPGVPLIVATDVPSAPLVLPRRGRK